MGSRLPEGLPDETVECVLGEGEQKCPVHGEQMQLIGKELVRRELKIVPAQATIVEYCRSAYICKTCEKTAEKAPIVKAPMPPQVIKGSVCATETAAHIIVQKFVMGTPLCRLAKDLGRNGIPLSKQTMGNWKYLVRFLLDGRLECNNNRSERSIKTFVINRKNFLFANSVAGARAAAILQSLAETAVENGLGPFEYLSYVLRAAAAGNIREGADLLNKLLPHNVPDFCRALR